MYCPEPGCQLHRAGRLCWWGSPRTQNLVNTRPPHSCQSNAGTDPVLDHKTSGEGFQGKGREEMNEFLAPGPWFPSLEVADPCLQLQRGGWATSFSPAGPQPAIRTSTSPRAGAFLLLPDPGWCTCILPVFRAEEITRWKVAADLTAPLGRGFHTKLVPVTSPRQASRFRYRRQSSVSSRPAHGPRGAAVMTLIFGRGAQGSERPSHSPKVTQLLRQSRHEDGPAPEASRRQPLPPYCDAQE